MSLAAPTALPSRMSRLANFINGEQVEPDTGEYLDVIEPATGQLLAQVPDSGAADIHRAVNAALNAFEDWSARPVAERARILLRLADLIEADLDALARDEASNTGKPITLARTVDIPRAVANFRFFATAVLHASSLCHDTDGRALNYTLRRPRGVAAIITPWNLPLYLLSWKVAPAIATGNTVVAKPSELTPLTACRLVVLATEAGLPPGVLNVVHGSGRHAGAELVRHPLVSTISFTGSTAVGRWIAQTAGEHLKRLSLELGGKNPFIVFADADLQAALDTALRAAFSNQGQICLCGSRLIVERSCFDDFLVRFVRRAAELVPGDPLDPATTFGALISRTHLDRVASYVDMARELGGTVRCGGQAPAPADLPARCRNGFFFLPTVITGLDPSCRVEQDEIFGPVVTVQPFDTEEQALWLANNTRYGLAASLWTSNLSRAHRFAARLQAGVIWINDWMLRDLRTPFGGMKQSGLGREGGDEAIRFFTEPQNVCVRIHGS